MKMEFLRRGQMRRCLVYGVMLGTLVFAQTVSLPAKDLTDAKGRDDAADRAEKISDAIRDVPEPVAPPEIKDVPEPVAPPEVKDVPEPAAPPEVKDVPEIKDTPEAVTEPEIKDAPEAAETPEVEAEPEVKDTPEAETEVKDTPETEVETEIKDAPESEVEIKETPEKVDNSGHGSVDSGDKDDDPLETEDNSGSGSSHSGDNGATEGVEEADKSEQTNEQAEASEARGAAAMRELVRDANADTDRHGFPTLRGEVVALDMDQATLDRAQASGFKLVGERTLSQIDSKVIRLVTPRDMSSTQALALLHSWNGNGIYDYAHYYGLGFETAGLVGGQPATEPMRHRAGNLRIGMIDTGVVGKAVFKGTRVYSRDFGEGAGAVPTDHGSAVASLLSGEGAKEILSANIFRANGDRSFTSANALISALAWMLAQKVDVVNMSLSGPHNAILDALIARSVARGYVVVAAAGNGGPTAAPAYPAAVDGVVAVTAVDARQQVYHMANQGKYIDLAARGVGVTAVAPDGSVRSFSGTSFAAPHVAAELARCMNGVSVNTARSCVARLEQKAVDLGAPGRDSVYGYGLVQ